MNYHSLIYFNNQLGYIGAIFLYLNTSFQSDMKLFYFAQRRAHLNNGELLL